jgi:hypothetical protein
MALDANMYALTTFATGRQQIEMMGLTPYKRILVPLLGTTAVSGSIRVVLEPGTRVAEVHTTFDLHIPTQVPDGGDAAVDLGQSEVLTDDHGKRYGKQFGEFLTRASVVDLDKGRNGSARPLLLRQKRRVSGQKRPDDAADARHAGRPEHDTECLCWQHRD